MATDRKRDTAASQCIGYDRGLERDAVQGMRGRPYQSGLSSRRALPTVGADGVARSWPLGRYLRQFTCKRFFHVLSVGCN